MRVILDLILHQGFESLKALPAITEVSNERNVSWEYVLDMHNLDHVLQVISGFQQVMLHLNRSSDLRILLNVLQGLDEPLDFTTGMRRV